MARRSDDENVSDDDDGATDDVDEPTADETTDGDTAEGVDETADEGGRPPAPRKTKRPSAKVQKADIAARREATKARMDEAKAKGEPVKPTKASADDPTGARARRSKGKGAVATASADDPTGTKARKAARQSSGVARPSKRTGSDPKTVRAAARSGNPKKAAEAAAESSRYTAPIPRSQIESPTWVPVLMFTFLGVGSLVILLTYVVWNARPLTLGIGLGCILAGILTATQYR